MAKRDLILHNFGWKVLSLFVAGLMWMAIWTALQRDEQKASLLQESPVVSTRTFPVPVAILNRATSATLFTVSPATVDIELSGKAADLERLQVKQITAFVDVTDAADEKQFRRVVVHAPGDFQIKTVTPASASVEKILNPK